MDPTAVELHATETLLQRGVKVKARAPLLFRLLGKKTITMTLKQPTGGAFLRMGFWLLQSGEKLTDLEEVTIEDALLVKVRYGHFIYRALACLFIGNKFLTKLFMKPVANWLMESLPPKDALSLLNLVVMHGGLKDFMNTTRLLRLITITPPRRGQ